MAPRIPVNRLAATLIQRAPPTAPTPARFTAPFTSLRSLQTSSARFESSPRQQAVLGSTCPSCGASLAARIVPLCPACSALLPPPPPSITSFGLFNLDPSYAIDLTELKKTFLQLQQKVHPDLFSGQGEMEAWAKSWSGKVNDAFKLLQGDRSRGEYLLSLSDVTIGEADPVTDPELLMSIMETREALEDATTEEEVAAIRDSNKEEMKSTFQALAEQFDATSPDLDQAKNLLIRLKYLENVEGVCKEWSPGKRVELQH